MRRSGKIAYMDVKDISRVLKRQESCRFIVEHILILAYSPTQFYDNNLGFVLTGGAVYSVYNLIGDVRYGFHVFTVVFKPAFPVDDRLVNLSHGDEVIPV